MLRSAKYLHCSCMGSYYINCLVVTERKFDYETDTNYLDKAIASMLINKSPHKYEGYVGYVIRYTDPVTGETEEHWTTKDKVKL